MWTAFMLEGTVAASVDAARNSGKAPEPERIEPETEAQARERAAFAAGDSLFGAAEWDEREAVRAAANRELNADLLGPAVERLGGIAVVSAGVLAAYLVSLVALVPRGEEPWSNVFPSFV